jgi:hypothetical protein
MSSPPAPPKRRENVTNPAEQAHFPGRPPFGPPPQPGYQQQFGQAPVQPKKGFMGALFDFGFDNFIAPKLVKTIYIVLVIVLSLGAAIMAIGSITVMATGGGSGAILGLIGLVMTPVLWLLGLMIYRVSLELMVVAFKISEDLRAIRQGSGTLR